jgi:hypothetical protein
MIDGKYAKNGLLRAISQALKNPRSGLEEMKSLFASSDQRSMVYEQIERDCSTLQQKAKSLSGQLSDLTTVELLGAEKTFRLVRRLVNFRPSKIEDARLHGPRVSTGRCAIRSLKRIAGFCALDDYYVRVLTLKELPGETRPLITEWPARHPGQLPCGYGMASGRWGQGAQGDCQPPPSLPQLEVELRLESPGPPEYRAEGRAG